jgi:dolichol-phosphate mannosyltransferase
VSVVIPARDEAGAIGATVRRLHAALAAAGVEHEIVVVDDHSRDRTAAVVRDLQVQVPQVQLVQNRHDGGFGLAVRAGIETSTGDAVAVCMADASDSPDDLVRFVQVMEERGVDCVFGSRFSLGGKVVDYPLPKLILNRAANAGIRALFGLRYDDVTNAFKLYRRHVIEGMEPLLSHHFNLTVEMPLKAIVRGYSYAVVPNSWTNRRAGRSKFAIQEMGSRYAFIVLYCFLERWLSRGDYRRPPAEAASRPAGHPASQRGGSP